jgi:hypothetical protein
MSIITKPVGGILKGIPATITLDKSLLQALPIVVADEYFSDPTNWKRVVLNYKSSEGKQYEIVEFDATVSSPTGTFNVSEKARDVFEIQSINILDFDGGIFTIGRNSLTTVDFDINFNTGGNGNSGGNYTFTVQNFWGIGGDDLSISFEKNVNMTQEQYDLISVGDNMTIHEDPGSWDGPTGDFKYLTVVSKEVNILNFGNGPVEIFKITASDKVGSFDFWVGQVSFSN